MSRPKGSKDDPERASKDSKLRVKAKTTQEIIDRCIRTIERETYKLERKSDSSTKPLDPQASNRLIEYLKLLVTIRKEERESIKGLQLTNKSTEELIELARKVIDESKPNSNEKVQPQH